MEDRNAEVKRLVNEAKRYLRELPDLDRRINAKLERSTHYRTMATRGTSTYSATRTSGTSQRSRVEDYVCKLVDLENELNQEIDQYVDRTREAIRMIESLPNPLHRDVLTYRYLNGWPWAKVADAMQYELRAVYYIHGGALKAIAECMQ